MKSSARFLDKFSNFSVTKLKKITFCIPAVIVLIALFVIIGIGASTGSWSDAVGIGIDFEGGTLLTVYIGEVIDSNADMDEEIDKITETIEDFGVSVSYSQKSYDSTVDYDSDASVTFRYKNISNDDTEIDELNQEIEDAVVALYADVIDEDTTLTTRESIGATAASDLLETAAIALTVSIILILLYIIVRFTLMSGVAAVLALIHDVIVMFALTVICRVQINTSFVAAVITIIAYSINNTIIIFDRCREYLKPLKTVTNIDYDAVGDMAVRDTLRRSVFTTITTMVTVLFLAILGGTSIQEFCVPIILGLIAGAYSSIFMAVPMWSSLSRVYDKAREKKNGGVIYKISSDEEEDDPTVYKGETIPDFVREAEAYDDDEITQAPVEEKTKKAGAPKKGKIYKYSKKNTTFKKKN